MIEATAENYFPARRELNLPGGGVAAVELHLDSTQRSGILAVTSPIVGADVSVDGQPMGKVPLETIVSAGPHTLGLVHPGYLPLQANAVVEAGARKDLTLMLEREAPITSKWWFWGTVGAVVVAGAAVTIALVSTRSPDKGTIAPGTLTSPLVSW